MNFLRIATKDKSFDTVYDILVSSFPSNERRSLFGQISLLEKSCYQLYAVNVSDDIIAVLAVYDLGNFVFVEHFAVDEKFRCGGIGTKILTSFLEKNQKPVVLEVEPPLTENAKRRISFYERLGFSFCDREYYQLPLNKGDSKSKLYLMSTFSISDENFDDIKNIIYEFVYNSKEF